MRRAALLALCVLCAAPARAETIVLSLSSHRVRITSTFAGADLVAFGAIDRDARTVARASDYDVVVTMRGPRTGIVVREKRPLGPIWVNRASRRYLDVPVTAAVLASRSVVEIADPELRRRHRIGLDALIPPQGALRPEEDPEEPAFRAALLRLKREAGLYVEDGRGATFLTPTIFQATIPVPATAPVGLYDVEVALFSGGVQLARATTGFQVTKTGFEQTITESARDHAWIYGAATAALSLALGWIASIIFRRD